MGRGWAEVLWATSKKKKEKKGKQRVGPPTPRSQRRRTSSAVGGSAHLVPGALRLPVQDGAQAPEAGVRPHLHPVGSGGGRGRGRGRGRGLDRTDVVGRIVGATPPQVGQVGETQLLWLQRRHGGDREGRSQRSGLRWSRYRVEISSKTKTCDLIQLNHSPTVILTLNHFEFFKASSFEL